MSSVHEDNLVHIASGGEQSVAKLFNSIGVAVVGRFVSSQALAAVGSNTPVINLLINLFMGITIGANVIISNHIGQHDKKSISDAVGTVGILPSFRIVHCCPSPL